MTIDVHLVGNLIWDRVCVLPAFPRENQSNLCQRIHESFGAVGNLLRSLRDPGLRVHVQGQVGKDEEGRAIARALRKRGTTATLRVHRSLNTSTAIVLLDPQHARRTSIVSWGACRQLSQVKPVTARWTHVCYLDALDRLAARHLRALREHSGILSADLCRSDHTAAERRRLATLLREVDYLFVADVEAESLTGRRGRPSARALGRLVRKGALIHAPGGSLLSDGTAVGGFRSEDLLERVAVLGAGDHFCARVIWHALARAGVGAPGRLCVDEQTVAQGHRDTTEFLRSSSEEPGDQR